MSLYRSPYEAYPFLCDAGEDLRCDFELLTDEMASRTGLLRSLVKDEALKAAHLLRVQGKQLVRLIYRWVEKGHEVPNRLLDLANLLSGYFFYLALHLNEVEGVDEVPYVSRNYPAR